MPSTSDAHDDNMDPRHPNSVLLRSQVSAMADAVESLEEANKAVIKDAIEFMDTMLDQVKFLIEMIQQLRRESTILATDIQEMSWSLGYSDAI